MADLGAGVIFGGINTLFKFSEFVIKLNEVGGENAVFVRTIQNVRSDLLECERLLHLMSIRALLAKNPDKRRWIETKVHGTKCAVNEIGLYVERARSDKERDGSISFANRVRWVMNDHEKLENRRMELSACHQSLILVLGQLHQLENTIKTEGETTVEEKKEGKLGSPPTYEVAVGDMDYRSPYSRRKNGKKNEGGDGLMGKTSEIRSMSQHTHPDTQSTNPYFPGLDYKALSPVRNSHQVAEPQCSQPPIPVRDPRTYGPYAGRERRIAAPVAELNAFKAVNPFGPVDPWELFGNPTGSNEHIRALQYPPTPADTPTWSAMDRKAGYFSSTIPYQHDPMPGLNSGYPSPMSSLVIWGQPLESTAQTSSISGRNLVQIMNAMAVDSGKTSANEGLRIGDIKHQHTSAPVETASNIIARTPYQNPYRIQSVELPAEGTKFVVEAGTQSQSRYSQESEERQNGTTPKSAGLSGDSSLHQYTPASTPYLASQDQSDFPAIEFQGSLMSNPQAAAASNPYFGSQMTSTYPTSTCSTNSNSSYTLGISPLTSPVSASSNETTFGEPTSRSTKVESQRRRRRRAMMDAALGLGG